jgi:Ino eighty subunit 1
MEAGSPTRLDEPDPRQSLQHVLSDAPANVTRDRSLRNSGPRSSDPKQRNKGTHVWIHEGPSPPQSIEEENSNRNDSHTRGADINPSHTMTVVHSRRNANGTIGSVYSGNKIKHLKKEDGIPLWRKDIQYSFLRAVFEDTTPVFTKVADGTPGHTFADIYIDAMARSTKTSKILREKLLSEREAALNMAMICLLVNVGRMNTTLNCEHVCLGLANSL